MHPVPQIRKTDIATTLLFRTQEAADLSGRLDDVSNIADPADRLLMLRQLHTDALTIARSEEDRRENLLVPKEAIALVSMGGYFAGALGGLAAGIGMICLPVGIGVGFATAVALVVRNKIIRKNDIEGYGDEAAARGISYKAYELLEKHEKEADLNVVARCPRAAEVFDTFPRLREKFLVAAELARINAAPALPSPKKPENGFRLEL